MISLSVFLCVPKIIFKRKKYENILQRQRLLSTTTKQSKVDAFSSLNFHQFAHFLFADARWKTSECISNFMTNAAFKMHSICYFLKKDERTFIIVFFYMQILHRIESVISRAASFAIKSFDLVRSTKSFFFFQQRKQQFWNKQARKSTWNILRFSFFLFVNFFHRKYSHFISDYCL